MLNSSVKGILSTTTEVPNRETRVNGSLPDDPMDVSMKFSDHNVTFRFKSYDNLPIIKWTYDNPYKFNMQSKYWRSLAAMFITTVKCGVDVAMLQRKDFVGGILRYHVALRFELLFNNPKLILEALTREDIAIIEKKIPTRKAVWSSELKTEEHPSKWINPDRPVCKEYRKYIHFESNKNDYRRMIERKSKGITEYGVHKITDSILTFIYITLLAQGTTGYPIAGSGGPIGMISTTQREFKRLHRTRVNKGNAGQNVRDVERAIQLIRETSRSISDWTDVSKGILRVPNNILLYKLVLNGSELQAVASSSVSVEESDGSFGDEVEKSNNNDNGTKVGLLVLASVVGFLVVIKTLKPCKSKWKSLQNQSK